MIHDEICTYEVCKLAKEKGFDVPTDRYYHTYDDVIEAQNSLEMTGDGCADFYNSLNQCRCAAPTQSLLQRWLREEKGVHIVIESEPTTTTSSNMLFQWIINYNSDGECYDCYNDIRAYPSYEKTLESALKFALENLV